MTTIHCEHCGPTRVDRHDTRCVTQIGHVGVNFGQNPHPLVDPHFLYDLPATVAAYQQEYPAAELSIHKTLRNEETGKPQCGCGYDPGIDHPDVEAGQMFAYIGQHIRQVNDSTR